MVIVPSTSDDPKLLDRGFFFVLVAIFTGVLYTGFFFLWKSDLLTTFQEEFSHLIIEAQSQTVKVFFEKYAIYGWAVFSLLLVIKSIIPFWLKNLFGLKKNKYANPVTYIIIYGAFSIFAWQIHYHEPRHTAIALGIIYLVAKPMLYSSAIITGLMTLVLIKRMLK